MSSAENGKTIKEFVSFLESEGKSVGRTKKYLYVLKNVSSMMKKDFKKADTDDIHKLIREVELSELSDWTKHDYKVLVKRFYQWLKKSEPKTYPKEVRWITTTMKNKNKRLPEILTEEEILKMVNVTNNQRDKTLIYVLYESGGRIGEILNMKLKDVIFDELGAAIKLYGKTGERRLRLVLSAQALREWINIHPDKNMPDSFLWVSKENHGAALSHKRISNILVGYGNKAGVKKRIYPHIFRHTRATHLAKILTEQELKIYMGWTQASDMAATYVHLSGKDLDDAVLSKVYGKKDVINNTNGLLKPKECSNCHRPIAPDTKVCTCGSIFDSELAMKLDREKEVQNALTVMIMKEMQKKYGKDFIPKMLKQKQIDAIIRQG